MDATLEIRRALLARFPYALVFLVREDEVRVLAVAHAKRRPGTGASDAGQPWVIPPSTAAGACSRFRSPSASEVRPELNQN